MSWKIEPTLTEVQARAYAAAVAEGAAAYVDPEAGLFVLTADALRGRGSCCGNACRHCPWDWANVTSHLRAQRERMAAAGQW